MNSIEKNVDFKRETFYR